MLRDGKYAAWFRTPHGQGTGIVHLADGRISGGDSFFNYAGSYHIENDRFTAVLTTGRHAEGAPTLFGPDEIELELSGVCNGTTATCSGTARQAPDVTFEATLIYCRDDAPVQGARRAVVKHNVRLPKDLDSRARPRPVFPASPRSPAS